MVDMRLAYRYKCVQELQVFWGLYIIPVPVLQPTR